jgi:hypothetical protein
MTDRQSFRLVNDRVRANASKAVAEAPSGFVVTIAPQKRSNDQNDHFHAICTDLANSPHQWFGKRRNKEEWKALLVSAHAKATNDDGEVIPGLEGELVAIRESTARMGVRRAASLITYSLAYCDLNGVELKVTNAAGYGHREQAA